MGLRHPIQWFESFYNFRITNEYPMPPAQKLIGKCKKGYQNVCTYRANFSNHLEKIEPWRKVFLYDVTQLREPNPVRSERFLKDLGSFLDLHAPLKDPMLWIKPGQVPPSSERAKELAKMKLNICDDQYVSLRNVLRQQASQSATWIRDVFMANRNVKVSSPDHFAKLIDSWHYDPCIVSGPK